MIHLTPSGTLVFEQNLQNPPSPILIDIEKKFQSDWREGWFYLGAVKAQLSDPTLLFWHEIASHLVTELCHIPPQQTESQQTSVAIPEKEQTDHWLLSAPPMVGGEYLNPSRICQLWEQLNQWVSDQSRELGGIHPFLTAWAPQWRQVGRVCFHLAENKKDESLPFAFLSTYSTGFGSAGKLKHLPLREALKQYSAKNNKQLLINLLSPVHVACEKIAWVKELLENQELFQPLAWTVQEAWAFLSSVPLLEESGVSVTIPNWWKKRPKAKVSVKIGTDQTPTLGVHSLLDFQIQTAIGDDPITEEELKELLQANQNLVNIRGQWVEVDSEKLKQALAHWQQIQQKSKNGNISFIEGMRLLSGDFTDSIAFEDREEIREWVSITPGEALSNLLRQLRDPATIGSTSFAGIQATLRPYQKEGVNWMNLVTGLGLGACLADDMGLGKTLQVLSLLKRNQSTHEKKTALLIVPASLLGNWMREAERFTPTLKIHPLHPSMQNEEMVNFKDFDLVITTYSMTLRYESLKQVTWDLIILDEAQNIKNHDTKQTKAIKKLSSKARIALTGTPIENRLTDLWSLFDFLNPGLLGTAMRFKEYSRSQGKERGGFEPLRKLIMPYILRRMKTDPKIITDLPAKIETNSYCCLTKEQAALYQQVVIDFQKTLASIPPKDRLGAILKTITQLKQLCNHPAHFSGNGEWGSELSGKFQRLKEICEELSSRQEKVLVFTQYSEIIPQLETVLSQIFGRKGLILHGGTPISQRKELVEAFQKEGGPPFFILSLKAGGTGLTLTAASHVIHFDRWWNPAVENQATDRAFRIGQKKNVQVHKFIVQGTIEEKIDAIIASKTKLSSEILSMQEEIKINDLSNEEILELFSLDLEKATAK
jgi:non-specific serine/threonine protein kinase